MGCTIVSIVVVLFMFMVGWCFYYFFRLDAGFAVCVLFFVGEWMVMWWLDGFFCGVCAE